MPAKKRTKPEPDSLTVNDDGTIDLRIRGEMVYLRCPTVGELQKFTKLHARLVTDLGALERELAEFQAGLLTRAQAVVAAAQGDEPEAAETPEVPEEIASDAATERALELVEQQRTMIAEFWAREIIAPLADPAPEKPLVAADLPAFFAHGGSVARAMKGWNSLPSDPGDG